MSSSGGKKKKQKTGGGRGEILDPDIVLKEVRRCRELMVKEKPKDMSKVDLSGMRVVSEMEGEAVAVAIEELFVRAAESIMKGESFKFDVPSRSASNQARASAPRLPLVRSFGGDGAGGAWALGRLGTSRSLTGSC